MDRRTKVKISLKFFDQTFNFIARGMGIQSIHDRRRHLYAGRILLVMLSLVPSRGFVAIRSIGRDRQRTLSQLRRMNRCDLNSCRRFLKPLVPEGTRSLMQGQTDGGAEGSQKVTTLDDFLADDEQLLFELSNSISDSKQENDWVTLDWNKFGSTESQSDAKEHDYRVARKETQLRLAPGEPSPVQGVMVRNRVVYLKRDDLIRLEGSNVSGNKARKMYALNQVPPEDFPDCVVSYGGPQSK